MYDENKRKPNYDPRQLAMLIYCLKPYTRADRRKVEVGLEQKVALADASSTEKRPPGKSYFARFRPWKELCPALTSSEMQIKSVYGQEFN